MAGIVISSKEVALAEEPFLYEKTEELEGSYIDFREVFMKCANNIFFSEITSKKILNLDIERKLNDYSIQSDSELEIIIDMYRGHFEDSTTPRAPLIELMLSYWVQSENFKNRASTALEEISKGVVGNRYKMISQTINDIEVRNLRDFYRYLLTEHYKPIETVVLTRIYKNSSRIFKTETPLVYYTRSQGIPDIKVMFIDELFQAKVTSLKGALA